MAGHGAGAKEDNDCVLDRWVCGGRQGAKGGRERWECGDGGSENVSVDVGASVSDRQEVGNGGGCWGEAHGVVWRHAVMGFKAL